MDSVMKFIGCCSESNLTAEVVITHWEAKYVKGGISLSLETRFWTNCTQVKRGDRLYLQRGTPNGITEVSSTQLDSSLVTLIHCENDYFLTGNQNFKLPVSNGPYSLMYMRPIKIGETNNERFKVMGSTEVFTVNVALPSSPQPHLSEQESLMDQSFTQFESEYHNHGL